MASRKLIAGNWKMNGLTGDSRERVVAMADFLRRQGGGAPEVLVCPPFTQLAALAPLAAAAGMALGAQDCHPEISGAFTGDMSAEMLKDAGCAYVIIGHSERRWGHGEGDTLIAAKVKAAWRAGLKAIICVGEREADRDSGQALTVVESQMIASIPQGANAENTVLAYEPVWAIGTGKTAKSNDISEMHDFIHAYLSKMGVSGIRILYGGSVKADNANEIMNIKHVDGVLVGGASLKVEEFQKIVTAAD